MAKISDKRSPRCNLWRTTGGYFPRKVLIDILIKFPMHAVQYWNSSRLGAIFKNKSVYLVNIWINILFFSRGYRCTLSPLIWIRGALVVVSTHLSCCLLAMVGCFLGNEVSRGLGWLGGALRAYLKRLSPAPSSHWGRCTLIQCTGTRDPCMQRWVARTKVIAILLLTYPHVFE